LVLLVKERIFGTEEGRGVRLKVRIGRIFPGKEALLEKSLSLGILEEDFI